jgi:hypothetical protein
LPSFTLSVYPPTSHWYPLPDRTCFTFLSFILKCLLMVQWSFALVFQTCMCPALIRSLLILSLLHYNYSTAFSALCYTISYRDAMYFDITHSPPFSFFLVPLCNLLIDTHTITISYLSLPLQYIYIYMCVCICVYDHVCIYVYILISLSSIYERKDLLLSAYLNQKVFKY